MPERITAVLDHVAVAVPDWEVAERRWRDELGGGRSSAGKNVLFISRQLQFANGGKLEMLSPASDDQSNFVGRFIDRFGSSVHHVTLKVPDLHAALAIVAAAGLEAVDIRDDVEYWKEAFLRPSQVGGLVVQIAETTLTDDDWAAFTGFTREPPRTGAAQLLGVTLRHPDLRRAEEIWAALGATVTSTEAGIACAWPSSAMSVHVHQGPEAGPVGLRMRGAGSLPPEEGVGPAVTQVN